MKVDLVMRKFATFDCGRGPCLRGACTLPGST